MFLPLYDKNPKRYIKFAYVNYSLIAITCLVYAVQYLLPDSANEDLTIYLGMIPVVVRDVYPQPVSWIPDQTGLVTYSFLHADWWHLLSNMLFLFIFGDNIEDALGHVKYFVFYIAAGVLAALAHLVMFPESVGPLIGASGAVAGIMGAYALLYPHARVFVLAKIIWFAPMVIPAYWMLGVWISTQFFYAFVGSSAPVAWWAHIGGAIAGVALAYLLKRRIEPLFGKG